MIPFFSVAREYAELREMLLARIDAVLASGRLLQSRTVEALEDRVAALCSRRHGIAVGSCTDALYFALVAAGIEPGDEVLVTDLSFVASAQSIARAGAVPVFVDVGPDYNLDLSRAAERVGPRTRALVYVHLFGAMGPPAEIEAFARDRGLVLVEDAAQAIGGLRDGRPAGSLGVASCMSFDPTKPIAAAGSGGMLLTDDDDLAMRARALRYHGKEGADFERQGYNSQLSSLSAAVIDVKLDHLDAWTQARRRIARIYGERLDDLDLALPAEPPASVHVFHKYVIRAGARDKLRDLLHAAGVETAIHYRRPLHAEPCFAHLRPATSPNALAYTATALSLPIHPFLGEAEVETVAEAVREGIASA